MPSFLQDHILSILTFLPLVGALLLIITPLKPKDLPEAHGEHDDEAHEPHTSEKLPADGARTTVNFIAVLFAGLNFALSVWLLMSFKTANTDLLGPAKHMQYTEVYNWITLGSTHIQYHMGIDGISLLLVVLTTFLMTLCVVFSQKTKQRLREFMIFLLLLETGMIGVFCALDLVLFYTFWEAMLIPMYFLIGIFGHENRIYAAVKFFIFTFAGSILMLVAIVATYQVAGTFDVMQLSDPTSAAGLKLHGLPFQTLLYLFSAFALAFMIKVPMFPFHTWLPDAHVEAPTAGSVILAGVMLKMGTYGFIRFCIPMFPEQAHYAAPLFITLAIIGIVYGSIVAAVQPDAKKLVAYSSVAHLGFVVLGIFTFTRIGTMGALIQNINHGISTPMLFFIVGMLYDRRHTREIAQFGGLKKIVPFMATMLLIATLSSLAVPFFNGFVGEFTILLGSWISTGVGYGPTAIAATGMILSAVYMLWWFQRLMLGPVTKPANRHLPDLSRVEWGVLIPLTIMVFWIGLGSTYWTNHMTAEVNTLVPKDDERIDMNLPIGQKMSKEPEEGENYQMVPASTSRPVTSVNQPEIPVTTPSGSTVPTNSGPEPMTQSSVAPTGATVPDANSSTPGRTVPPTGRPPEKPAAESTMPNTPAPAVPANPNSTPGGTR